MVGTIAPGTRITAVAIYSTVQVRERCPRCAVRDGIACHALPVQWAPKLLMFLLTDRVWNVLHHVRLAGHQMYGTGNARAQLLPEGCHQAISRRPIRCMHDVQGGSAGKQRDTKDAVAIQVPYMRVVGLEEEAEGAHSTPVFTCGHP